MKKPAAKSALVPAFAQPRCRRGQLCLAAHDNLYCHRTHFSPPEIMHHEKQIPLAREIANLGPLFDPTDSEDLLERMSDIAAIGRAHQKSMTARWKAGEFDGLYERYKVAGVLLKPPPKFFTLKPAP